MTEFSYFDIHSVTDGRTDRQTNTEHSICIAVLVLHKRRSLKMNEVNRFKRS